MNKTNIEFLIKKFNEEVEAICKGNLLVNIIDSYIKIGEYEDASNFLLAMTDNEISEFQVKWGYITALCIIASYYSGESLSERILEFASSSDLQVIYLIKRKLKNIEIQNKELANNIKKLLNEGEKYG